MVGERAILALGTGAALACSVLLAVLMLRAEPPARAPAYMVVLVAPQDKAPGWVVQTGGSGRLNLIPLGMATVPQEKALQFWTRVPTGTARCRWASSSPARPRKSAGQAATAAAGPALRDHPGAGDRLAHEPPDRPHPLHRPRGESDFLSPARWRMT
jgi:hypothetical protein